KRLGHKKTAIDFFVREAIVEAEIVGVQIDACPIEFRTDLLEVIERYAQPPLVNLLLLRGKSGTALIATHTLLELVFGRGRAPELDMRRKEFAVAESIGNHGFDRIIERKVAKAVGLNA